nr:MAG TPA: hypothetical protein [Caudoviricetes sp.]
MGFGVVCGRKSDFHNMYYRHWIKYHNHGVNVT